MGLRIFDWRATPSRLFIDFALVFTLSGLGSALAAVAGATTTTMTVAPNTLTPGDIPDTVAYVTYSNPVGHYKFKHPEGWAQVTHGTSVLFTDSYNGVALDVASATKSLTSTLVSHVIIPKLRSTQTAFHLLGLSPTKLPAGPGFLIIYQRNSPSNAVTNKSVRQEVHLYVIYAHGRVMSMSLFGAVGADNVDPYAKMSQSLRAR